MSSTQHELRCECSSRHLLAHYGRDENDKAYVLMVTVRNGVPRSKIYSNQSLKIWCASCDRWWTVRITNNELSMEDQLSPPALPSEKPRSRVLLDNTTGTQ